MLATKIEHKKNEEGFTLIELLVVVIIIGILAAIAIPTFLAQRERAWEAAVQSDLRNAAVAQESHYTNTTNSYAPDLAGLTAEGFTGSANVTLSVESGDAAGYCMEAFHVNNATEVWSLSNANGEPVLATCS